MAEMGFFAHLSSDSGETWFPGVFWVEKNESGISLPKTSRKSKMAASKWREKGYFSSFFIIVFK